MAIISANRYGRLNGSVIFATNESYGMDDIGHILQEEEMNEMNLFNAIIMSDMHETQAKLEGTMLESEIKAFQEASAKNFFKGLAAKLKVFWEKIKGVFKKAYANIAAFGVKYGTVWYKANKKEIEKLNKSMTVPGTYYHKKKDIKDLINQQPDVNTLISKGSDETTAAQFNDIFMGVCLGEETVASKEKGGLYDCMKTAIFDEIKDGTLEQLGGEALVTDITGASKLIKDLQGIENKLQASVKDSIRQLEQAADGEAKLAPSAYTNAVSGSTTAISMIVRNAIKIAKLQMVQARKILTAAIHTNKKKSATTKTESAMYDSLLESLLMEAEEDVASMSDETSEDLTAEQEELVDAIIDAAEALKDCEGSEEPEDDEPAED